MENYNKYGFMVGQPIEFAAPIIGDRQREPFDVANTLVFVADMLRQIIMAGYMGNEFTDSVIASYRQVLRMVESETDTAADVIREIVHTEMEWIDKNA
jgi:hypothetical protein